MEELYDNGIYSVRPNNITYTTVIESHVKNGAENAGEKAEAVLRRMEKRFLMNLNTNDEVDVDIDPDMKPDIQAYNTVLAGYANTDKPEKAEELLMSILSSDGPLAVEPNHVSLNTVMSGWARRGDYDRAEGLLMKMHKLHISCSLHTKPDVISYNTVLDALAKAGKRSRDKEESRRLAKRGSDILAHMECLYEDSGDANVKPNSRTYNTCINIFAKAGMIDEADALLQTFTKVAEDGVESSVVDGKPTVRTHNTLLSACMIRGQVAMAMSFWRRMKDQGIESDVVTYNTLLKCHARALSRKPPVDRQRTVKSARYIMQELKRENVIRPNQITYAAFVDVLLLNNEAEAAQEYLFGLLKDNSDKTRKNRASGPNPDRSVFHRILAEYGRKKTPRKAESLLHMMSDQSIEYGVDLHPNTETYNLLLRCWSESGDREAGERASMIVRFMQDSSIDGAIKVDIESYIQTLLSWRNSGDLTALNNIDSLILEMLLKQDRDLLPNEVCYDIWLDAIADSNVVNKRQKVRDAMKSMKVHNFVPKGRLKKKIEQLLEDCCE
jgi:pentatricopeptide repeat protein